jgi:uncharacterized protein
VPRFEPRGAAQGPVIQGFAGDGFVVDGRTHRSVLLAPESVTCWAPPVFEALSVDDFAPLLALAPPPEFLILGTGPTTRPVPRPLLAELEARGIGIEAMDSRAAARTWGLLRSEERWIAAALMPLA